MRSAVDGRHLAFVVTFTGDGRLSSGSPRAGYITVVYLTLMSNFIIVVSSCRMAGLPFGGRG